MNTHPPSSPRAPDGLSRRARYFVEAHGLRVPCLETERYRESWAGHGIPATEIDRVAAFQERWGGIALPPAPFYGGGPRVLDADTPEGSPTEGWWFSAGEPRVSTAYGFMIGPEGEFGVHAEQWVPLHASIEGWVEALALAHHAALRATSIIKIKGGAVDDLDLTAHEPVPEVQGITDSWWRGTGSLIAVYSGEAECLAAPQCRAAHIYSGLGA